MVRGSVLRCRRCLQPLATVAMSPDRAVREALPAVIDRIITAHTGVCPACSHAGCHRTVSARGLCAGHYQQLRARVVRLAGWATPDPADPHPDVDPQVPGQGAVSPITGRRQIVCDRCGEPIAADDRIPEHVAAAARHNHRRFCVGGAA